MTRGWVRVTPGAFSLDVAWHVQPGEVLVLYGPSGAGKTLTLRTIAGLVRPREGWIEIDGRTVFNSATGHREPPFARQVGYVPQDYSLFPHLTAEENIGFGLHRWDRRAAKERVSDLLSMFQLESATRLLPHQLSGGQRQRVALARALASGPRLLLLDEPLSAIDEDLRHALRQELRGLLAGWHVPVILVTHDRADALYLGHRVQVIRNGRVEAEGLPTDVFALPPGAEARDPSDMENVFDARVLRQDREHDAMLCQIGDVALWTRGMSTSEGASISLRWRARDTLLAMEAPRGITTRNLLRGHIESLEAVGKKVEATVLCGALPIRVRVSADMAEALDLQGGRAVWVIIPESALSWVEGPTHRSAPS